MTPHPSDRIVYAEDAGRIVATWTGAFAPVTFEAQPAGLRHLAGLLSNINLRLADGIHALSSAERKLLDALLSTAQQVEPRRAPACNGGRRCEIFLLLAQSCNLGCHYCLDGDVTYQISRARRMTLGTALAAIEFFSARLVPGDELAITFFGGEPLLNWSIVPEIAAQARRLTGERGLSCSLAVQSNLTFLPKGFVETVRTHRIGILGSIDGPAEIHDVLRPTKAGEGSFAASAQSLATLVKEGVPFDLRATITSLNDDRLAEVAALHEALGARSTSFGALRPIDSDGATIRPDIYPRPDALERGLRQLLRERPAVMDEVVSGLLERMAAPRDELGCDAGRLATPAVDADGSIYSCVWFVGRPEHRLGGLGQNPILREDAEALAARALVGTTDPVCAACDYFALCQGGCGVGRVLDTTGTASDVLRAQQCALVKTAMNEILLS